MKTKDNPGLSIDALFLGIKSENASFFRDQLLEFVNEHIFWRKDFHPEDQSILTLQDQNAPDFIATKQKTIEVLQEMSSILRDTSDPWHSPRYLGQMNSDILMPSLLAYMGATMYNPNNVAYEASPGTSKMELEVGRDFARLMGFETGKGWGHICADGSIANFEGLWYARNIKSIPFGVKAVKPELVAGKSDWQLSNMTVDQILDLSAKVQDVWDQVRNNSVRGVGVNQSQLGKWIVPQTKHYSWVKAGDVLGIGLDNVQAVEVDDHFRMNMATLEKTINDLISKKIPVLGVVAVMGTTEEGAVDHLDQIIALRKKFEVQGVSFYIHADAAYGGYTRSLFMDENNQFMQYDVMKKTLHDLGIFRDAATDWPSEDVYNAYKALSEADSVTIDPHKMGYVPYAAGGITIRDERMLEAISFFAPYVFVKGTDISQLLGSFIMEGSKAGATAASVWVAHRIIPLNVTGYGKLIGASIEGASRFFNLIESVKPFDVNGVKVILKPLVKPDFNMVDFAFNIEGNTDLEKMNNITIDLFNLCNYISGPLYKKDFITSHTEFTHDDYGDSPKVLTRKLGIPDAEWDKIHSIWLLRACVLTPYFVNEKVTEYYWENFLDCMKEKLSIVLDKYK
jgi:tyrosine decarboxylase